jgi:hypothetical protein
MATKIYRVVNPHTQWVCGKRVNEDGTVALSDAQADYDLARGTIEPALPEQAEATPRKKGEG